MLTLAWKSFKTKVIMVIASKRIGGGKEGRHPNKSEKAISIFDIYDLRQNSGHVESLSTEIGQIGHDENKYGLDDTNMICESSDEACQKSPNDSYGCSSKSDNGEGCNTFDDFHRCNVDIIGGHLGVVLKHVV